MTNYIHHFKFDFQTVSVFLCFCVSVFLCLCVCVYACLCCCLCAHIVIKMSRTNKFCEPTYIFIRVHLVSIAHITRKISRTKISWKSTNTGHINSPDIAQRLIHPRVHLSTLLVMSVWQYRTLSAS